jgi:hypothetical protein
MKPKPKHDSILIGAPDADSLEGFVYALNTDFFRMPVPSERGLVNALIDYRPVRDELRNLVKAWVDSGPNTSKLFSTDPVLATAAHHTRAFLIPTSTRVAKVMLLTAPENMPVETRTIAIGLFLSFLIDPRNNQLAGPCASCGRYFVNKTSRRKRLFCSVRCGHKLTSRKANEERRKREHEEQLELVNRLILEWQNNKTRLPWKAWVANRRIVSKTWLTRAVNRGEIIAPAKNVGEGFRWPRTD